MGRPPLYDVFPRGKRPVTFPFRLPPEQDAEVSAIPGVLSMPDGYVATWDAALVLYQKFGWPAPQFPAETSDLPGLEGYFARGLHEKLRNYQWRAASFLANRPYAILGDPMRCLDGDAVVYTNRGGKGERKTLRELHRFETSTSPHRDHSLKTSVGCYDEEGSIISNELVATHYAGIKEGFEVRVSEHAIIASEDHKFRTPDGYVALKDLRPGDVVLMRERAPATTRAGSCKNPYRVVSVRGHPYARVYHVKRRGRPDEIVHHVLKHRLVYEAEVLNGMSVQKFVKAVRSGDHSGLTFLEPGTHVHHKNEDPTDNRASNLEVLTKSEHHREHAEAGAKRHVLFRGVPRPIESITPVGPREMYDLTLRSPLNNYVANEFVVHNSGKTLSTLAGLQLIDAKSVCIVCPSIAKWVWAKEVAKWLGEEVLILEGRSMREGRAYCKVCSGSGRVVEGGRTRRCRACRQWNGQSYGYRIYEVQTLNAQDTGSDVWYCRQHPEVSTTDPDGPQILCKKCQVDLEAQVRSAKYVVTNPDILAPQREKIGGVWKFRSDMPGLGKFLAAVGFDTVVVDEAHMFRARPRLTKEERHRGDDKEFRAEALSDIGRSAERMWMLTGTPIYAYLRDIYMLLHLASHGVWGDQWSFDRYFCMGHKGEHGWVNTGKSWRADEELSWRLKFYLLKRELRDIRPELPAKQRDVRRYDAPPNLKVKRVKGGDYQAAVDEAIKNVSKVKIDPVVEECLNEMSEGRKVVVFAYYRETAKKLFQAFEHATKKSRSWKSRMESVGARVWLADGEVSPKNRVAMGEKFVAHQTAGAFVATIEAFQVAVSLAGASTVHFAELHPVPGAVLQAEARPEDGTTPLMVVYHVVNNSIDAQCLLDLQEKIDQIDSAVGDKDAAALAATFGSVEEEKAHRAEKLFARMLADLKEEDFDD